MVIVIQVLENVLVKMDFMVTYAKKLINVTVSLVVNLDKMENVKEKVEYVLVMKDSQENIVMNVLRDIKKSLLVQIMSQQLLFLVIKL